MWLQDAVHLQHIRCQVHRMSTDYSWCLLHMACSRGMVALAWMSHWEERTTPANYFAMLAETLRGKKSKQIFERARQWAPIWKLQARGIFKCMPRVDICHLAPGIIAVGIWHWQQCQSSTFIDDKEKGNIFLHCPWTHLTQDFDWKYWHCRYIYTCIKWNVQGEWCDWIPG